MSPPEVHDGIVVQADDAGHRRGEAVRVISRRQLLGSATGARMPGRFVRVPAPAAFVPPAPTGPAAVRKVPDLADAASAAPLAIASAPHEAQQTETFSLKTVK